MGNYEFNLAQNYTTLYLMIQSKEFFKHCPSITGFSIMGDCSPSSVKKWPNPSPSKVNPPIRVLPYQFFIVFLKILIPFVIWNDARHLSLKKCSLKFEKANWVHSSFIYTRVSFHNNESLPHVFNPSLEL